jgi:hypothetical protein
MSAEKPYSKDAVGCEQSDYAIVAAWVLQGAGSYELFHLCRVALRIGERRLLVHCNRFDSGDTVLAVRWILLHGAL